MGDREQNTARSERDGQASADTGIDTPIGRELDTWGGRTKKWFLLDGSRLYIAALTATALLAVFGASTAVGLLPLGQPRPIYTVLGALIGGNMTLITVVVSINQLLLSQELKSPGELEAQIEDVIDYRREVEEAAGELAPVQPMGFLQLLFENTRREAQRIGGLTVGADHDARDDVNDLVTTLTDHIDEVDAILDEADSTTFAVLSATLTTNYAAQIHHARQIRRRWKDELSDRVLDCLDRLIDRLQDIDVARQYFKSIYLQEELSSLSRVLLYAGLPAEAFAIVALLSFSAAGGTTVLAANRDVLLPVALTVGLLPLVILFSFIVRIATVTERTVATIPFTTPEQEQ